MTLFSLFKTTNNNSTHTLISGDDAFLNAYLANSYVSEARFNDFDKVSIDCEEEGLDNLIAALTEASLFSQRKIITVRNPFFLTSKVPQKFQKQLKQLQGIFENANKIDDIIILLASYDKIDRRKKLTKTVLKQFNVVDTHLKAYEVRKAIMGIIKNEGYRISSNTVQLLLERSDQVLDVALSNYNKLKMIASDKQITSELIKKNIDLSLAQNVFAILDSALKGNYHDAINRLNNQLNLGNNPIQLLAVFENQLELILVVKVLQKRGRTEAEIVKKLGVHPYRVKLALKNPMSVQKLAKLLEHAIELDFNYKSGQFRDNNFLKLYILSV